MTDSTVVVPETTALKTLTVNGVTIKKGERLPDGFAPPEWIDAWLRYGRVARA